jgi:DNA repair exonuclease SbcCD nuclease subunit
VKFYHISDVHIGRSFNSGNYTQDVCSKRRQDIKETFYKVLDMCVEEGIELLLISGDLFEDKYISLSELTDIYRKFQMMAEVQIVICAGNHDPIINEESCYNLVNWSENVHIFGPDFSKISLEELNTDIYSFSWQTKEITEMDLNDIVIEDYTKNNILMLHGDAYNSSVYLPLDMAMLETKGFDYIALGHIHKPDCSNEKWAYPGSLEPLDFSETGEHGFIKGTIEDSVLSYQFMPMAKRQHIIKEVLVNEDMSFEEIKDLIIYETEKEMLNNCMFKVYLRGMKDINVKINTKELKEAVEQSIFFCQIIDETINNYDLERVKSEHEGNIVEAYVQYMEEKGLEDPIVREALNEGLSILLRERVG